MLKTYNQKIKQIKKIDFLTFNFTKLFILKKKYIKQNIQKEFEYYLKQKNFLIFKPKQRQLLNILKKTHFKQSLLSLKGNLIYLYFNQKNIILSLQILYFLNALQKFNNFNKYFQFCLLLDFKQNLIITNSLLNYYSSNFTNILIINLQKIYKLLIIVLIKLTKFLLTMQKIKGGIA